MGRRWLRGFEFGSRGSSENELNAGAQYNWFASRMPGLRDPNHPNPPIGAPPYTGLGYAIRSADNEFTGQQSDTSGTPTIAVLYDALSFRIRRYPVGSGSTGAQFYSSTWSTSQSILVTIDDIGVLRIYNKPNANPYPGTFLGILNLGVGYRNIWVNMGMAYAMEIGMSTFSNLASLGIGVVDTGFLGNTPYASFRTAGSAALHIESRIGKDQSGSTFGLEMDVDDWDADDTASWVIGATSRQTPTGGAARGPILVVRPIGQGTYTEWAGDTSWPLRSPIASDYGASSPPMSITSSTSGAKYSINLGTLADQRICLPAESISAFRISVHFDGGLPASSARLILRVSGTEYSYTPVLYNSFATICLDNGAVPNITPTDTLEIGITKDANGTLRTVTGIWLEVQVSQFYPTAAQIANPYDTDITYAMGQYVGNGTFQEIALGFAPDCVFLCQIISPTGGGMWWNYRYGMSQFTRQNVTPEALPRVTTNGFIVGGTTALSNQSGRTYSYVAFRDPQRRGWTSGGFTHATADAAYAPNCAETLTPQSFVPSFQLARIDYRAAATAGLYAYLEGKSTVEVSTGTILSNALFSLALAPAFHFLVGPALFLVNNSANTGVAYCHWRTDQFTAQQLWNTTSYVGDGTGSRVISLPLGNTVPSFVLVLPTNNVTGVMRLHGMAGANSVEFTSGGYVANGITALGVNQFTVASPYNVSGVTYMVFGMYGMPSTSLPTAPWVIVVSDPAPPAVPPTNHIVDMPPGADGGQACRIVAW